MKRKLEVQWKRMTTDELFVFHELVLDVLRDKLKARKADIERRLHTLKMPSGVGLNKGSRL